MSLCYHIRYTCSGEVQSQVVDFIMRNADKYIIAKEIATREHLQCYIETKITKKTWVNKFNLRFKNLDRRDKYVELDKGNTKFYVCKENDILGHKGFTPEEIVQFRAEYEKNHRPPPEIKFEENVENIVGPPLKPKKKKPTFMCEIRQVLEEEYPDREWSKNDKQIVFKKIMFMLGAYCRNLDHIIISRMTYGVLNSLVKDKKEWLEYWYQKSFGEPMNLLEENMDLDSEF